MAKTPKSFKSTHDPMFAQLVLEVTRAIEANKDGTSQKQQFEELTLAERLFHESILSSQRISTELYKKFIQLIRVKNKNILSARPFFRESSDTFSAKITPALKANDHEALKVFAINFHFIVFAKKSWIGLWPKKAEILYRRVERARNVLVENNFPLAINRAKIFYRKTPKGHLSFNDMIEASAMGLCAAVDKYTGSYKSNFCGVIIGRSTGNLIDEYSATQIHFYPTDRRILYRANSIRGRQGITDIVELTKAVNDSFAKDLLEGMTAPKPVSVVELSDLLAAASLVSADSNVGEQGFGVYDYTPDNTDNAEESFIKKEETSEIARLAQKLPLINKKVLRLKGIEI
jgi:DNA-directed RNA polymerase specialized sigma subunit